jgi:hypothetical protein
MSCGTGSLDFSNVQIQAPDVSPSRLCAQETFFRVRSTAGRLIPGKCSAASLWQTGSDAKGGGRRNLHSGPINFGSILPEQVS